MEVVVMPSPWRWSHSPAILLPSLEQVAVHPVFLLPVPVIPVDPAAVSLFLAFAGFSVPHPGAFIKVPIVEALVDHFVFVDYALVPFGEFVAGDPEFYKILGIPVDIAAAGLETLAWALVSPVLPGAILPDPIAVASSSEGREKCK